MLASSHKVDGLELLTIHRHQETAFLDHGGWELVGILADSEQRKLAKSRWKVVFALGVRHSDGAMKGYVHVLSDLWTSNDHFVVNDVARPTLLHDGQR
jgi:hypothetical protein